MSSKQGCDQLFSGTLKLLKATWWGEQIDPIFKYDDCISGSDNRRCSNRLKSPINSFKLSLISPRTIRVESANCSVDAKLIHFGPDCITLCSASLPGNIIIIRQSFYQWFFTNFSARKIPLRGSEQILHRWDRIRFCISQSVAFWQAVQIFVT